MNILDTLGFISQYRNYVYHIIAYPEFFPGASTDMETMRKNAEIMSVVTRRNIDGKAWELIRKLAQKASHTIMPVLPSGVNLVPYTPSPVSIPLVEVPESRAARIDNCLLVSPEEISLLEQEGINIDTVLDTCTNWEPELIELIEHLEDPDRVIEKVKKIAQKYVVFSTPRYLPYEDRSTVRKFFHVKEYDKKSLHNLLSKFFSTILIFTQTDEVITSGNPDVCWTYIAICL